MTTPRERMANGEESRRKIIYWPFADKDAVIAGLIRNGFEAS